MSNVVAFPPQTSASAARAVGRLNEIWKSVEAFTLQIQYEHLTPAEMMRVLRIFSTANSCIRIVLSDFRDDPAIDHLVSHSREIAAMIEAARERVAGLIEGRHGRLASLGPAAAGSLGE